MPVKHREQGILAGSTVFVTGASRGIGSAVARKVHAAGAQVGLVARSADDLEVLAGSLGAGVATATAAVAAVAHASAAPLELGAALPRIADAIRAERFLILTHDHHRADDHQSGG